MTEMTMGQRIGSERKKLGISQEITNIALRCAMLTAPCGRNNRQIIYRDGSAVPVRIYWELQNGER